MTRDFHQYDYASTMRAECGPRKEMGPDFHPGIDVEVDFHDTINHPKHYTSHPSGIECIEIVEHMGFCIGNAIKYCWRAGLKSDSPLEDLKKGRWYIDREIARLEKGSSRLPKATEAARGSRTEDRVSKHVPGKRRRKLPYHRRKSS